MRALPTRWVLFFLVPLFSAGFLASQALAEANLDMHGEVSYDIGDRRVSISVAQINNFDPYDASGNLNVSLWATATPYAGGTLEGFVLYGLSLEGLEPGTYMTGVRMGDLYDPPPAAEYWLTLGLFELVGQQYVLRDFHTFAASVNLHDENDSYKATENAALTPYPPEYPEDPPPPASELGTGPGTQESGCFLKSLFPGR